MKALYNMREGLELLDFEDASINDMKRMLLQVGSSRQKVWARTPVSK